MIDFQYLDNHVQIGDYYCSNLDTNNIYLNNCGIQRGYYKVIYIGYEGVVLNGVYGYQQCDWSTFNRLVKLTQEEINSLKAQNL